MRWRRQVRRICDLLTTGGAQKVLPDHEAGNRGPEVRFRCVPEFGHQRVLLERLLHQAALDALPAAVYETNLAQAGGVRGGHVLDNDRDDVAWLEGVEIEGTLDRNLVWLVHARSRQAGGAWSLYVAVTTVLIPPRTVKSPTTVMRRGWTAATRSSRI